jgi:hypothetical protein
MAAVAASQAAQVSAVANRIGIGTSRKDEPCNDKQQ